MKHAVGGRHKKVQKEEELDDLQQLQFMQLGGHSAYWGCFTCLISGEPTAWGLEFTGGPPFHFRRPAHYFSQEFRNHGFAIHGTPSMLQLLPPPTSFNIIWGTVLDPMHNLFLGVTVNMFEKIWFVPEGNSFHNIHCFKAQIDQAFLKIAVPHDWTRKPSSLSKAATWKGKNIEVEGKVRT